MKIEYHRSFLKSFRKRVRGDKRLVNKFEQRLKLRIVDPENYLLQDHQLIGKKFGYRAFSVTGDVRVVYKIEGDILRLYDIGSHNQVY
jgi:addiction module RelE/StbE family toxin